MYVFEIHHNYSNGGRYDSICDHICNNKIQILAQCLCLWIFCKFLTYVICYILIHVCVNHDDGSVC
jgi:hypothetical protein